jgi:integrase/recombinase XerD
MASSPFESEWRGINNAEENAVEQQEGGLATQFAHHNLDRATLDSHLEVHMSDRHFSHEVWLSKLRDHLTEERYAARTARQCIAVARNFLRCLDEQKVDVGTAQPASVEEYLQQARRLYRRRHGHPPDYKGWQCLHTNGIHMLLRLVQGQWPPAPKAVTPIEILQNEMRGEYAEWMAGQRGLAPGTVSHRCCEAGRLLDWLGERATREELATLTHLDVDGYLKYRATAVGRRSLKDVTTKIRSFLRWLSMTERTSRDLSSTVITPMLYAFESIPSALRSGDVEKILAATRQDCTQKGIRDYAILMLISKYGIRSGEIATLRLNDVDWRQEVIRIRHGKTGAISYLPLLPEVGEAVLKYLQDSRPKTSFREIFIRACAPYRPFRCGSSLYRLVRHRLEAANVTTTGKRGPHAFRHARAVSMLRATVSVKDIGDLLGHRAADSTLVYLKLATEDLRAVALEIPTGVKA